jgi:PTS system mannose-specific IIB component
VPAALVRIDERLLHGQVLLTWAAALRPDRIVLASDGIAADPTRRRVYEQLGEEDYAIEVAPLAAIAAALAGRERLLVVVGSPAEALRLVELGAAVERVNVGGLRGAGKRQLTSFVHLSRDEAQALRALLERGIELEARELPAGPGMRIDAATLDRLWPPRAESATGGEP